VSVLEYVLDGLAEALELERELGVRTVEIDRGLLRESGQRARAGAPLPQEGIGQRATDEDVRCPSGAIAKSPNHQTTKCYDFVFLHDRPLSAGGVEMMAKIVLALGRTAETTPVIVEAPLPQAKIYVVLGGRALKKYFPELKGEPGVWGKSPEGVDVLITYSPEFILRYGEVTPAVKQMKQSMWQSLKAVKQRMAL